MINYQKSNYLICALSPPRSYYVIMFCCIFIWNKALCDYASALVMVSLGVILHNKDLTTAYWSLFIKKTWKMCFWFRLSWISFIWIMQHNHMECFIFPNVQLYELWKCPNVKLYELWKYTNVQLYELCKCTNVQLYELWKWNSMKWKQNTARVWSGEQIDSIANRTIKFTSRSLVCFIFTPIKNLENIYIPPWFYTFQSQVQPYQYCVQVWSWREGLLTFTWVVIAITLLRICLPRWSAWHGMVWCVTTRKPCWLVWQARVWYGIRYGKVSKGMASKGTAWYQVWQGK